MRIGGELKRSVGSSSGSAVAVSANLVPLAIGTETDTSIIGPASINGVVGLKPTVGTTSRSGVIPISKNLDTVGCFGRTVADAVHGLDAIAGPDEEDPFTCTLSRPDGIKYCESLSSYKVLKGARFGLPQRRCWELVPDSCKKVTERVFNIIVEAGGQIIDTEFPCAEDRIASDGNWDW